MTTRITRRTTLAGAAVTGLPLLAACGGDSEPTPSGPATTSSPSEPESSATAKPTKSAEPEPPAEGFADTSEVPVGGGAIFEDESVVVTQPSKGEFKGFSSTCTHKGCAVSSVEDGTINCPCHGSMFSIADGSVAGGPATSPLPSVDLVVEGGRIARA